MEYKILATFSFIILVSCSPDIPEDLNRLQWATAIEIPLFKDDITLETLAEDSLISIEQLSNYFQDGELSDSIFVYHKKIKIDKVEVGDNLDIDPISSNFNQNIDDVTIAIIEKNISSQIGVISLNDIEPTDADPFIFSDIYPEILDIPSGNVVAIPSFEIAPVVKQFSFEDFGFAEFSQGILELSIINNMVIPLGSPLLIELLQISIGDTVSIPGATIQFDELIDANNGNAIGTIDLSDVSLPGEILVKVSGNCQGTSGIEILIDDDAKNSGFVISIGGLDMEVISTNAKIPQQSIEESGTIELEPDSNKVVSALIENGKLIIEIDNYMGLSSVIDIFIPSLEDPTENMFTFSTDIPANVVGIDDETSLTNFSLVMDPDNQSVIYNYNVLTVDSGDDFILIESNDSINVNIRLEGNEQGSDITFSKFTGYLSQDALVDSSTINIDTATKVDEATLNSGQLKLSITNDIGIDALVNFSINEFTKNGVILDTSFSISIQPTTIYVDLKGYVLDLELESNPQTVNYISTIDIPSEDLISLDFGQSISIDVNLDSISFSQVSGYVDPVIIEIDSIEQEIDLPEEISDLDFSIIDMDFSFQSSLTLPVFLNLELLSVNDETGATYTRSINNVNITQTPKFSVDSIEQLININPHRIIATGNAKVGSLNEYGAVSSLDSLSGLLTIAAPLAFEIDNDSKIELDPEELDVISIDDLINADVFIDYENNLELGADIFVLIANDTNFFNNGQADTLAELTIKPSQTGLDSLTLDQSSFELLAREGNYSKAFLSILGNDEGPTRFLSTDTIKYSIFLSTEIIIDPNSSE